MKNNNKLAVINMAFGTGSESKEGTPFDKYVGVAPFFVLGVNLSKDDMKALYPERNYDKDFDYAYSKEGEAKGTFVTFLLQTNKEHAICQAVSTPNGGGVDFNSRASYLIKDEIYMNKDKNKVQVINDYGDTIWMTSDEFKAKTLPEYAVKQGYITTGMRPAYVGEEELIKFLKTYINIPNSRNYKKDEGWSAKVGADLEQAICGFSVDEIKKIANGDVSPVRNAVKHQPKNQIKFLCGIRTASDNKEYQEVCTRIPIKFAVTDYKNVDVTLQAMKDNGAYANSNFGVFPYTLKKYEVGMSSFEPTGGVSTPAADSDPFAGFN